MEHGYAEAGLDGLKEYMGTPDEVVALTGDAELLVTHLAPLSAGIMERLPALRFVAVSRGGPVNIDMNAARDRGILVVNTPGRNASAVAEFAIGAIIAETRNITRGHDALRRDEWRGDLYRADRHRSRTLRNDRRRDRLRPDRHAGRSAAQGIRLPHPGCRSLCPALCRRPQ